MIDRSALEGNVQPFVITIDTSVTTGTGTERIRGALSGFRAQMVLIDNFTNQYLYEAASGTWVPPQTQGYRVLLPVASAVVDIYVNTPPGVTALARVNGQVAIVKYLENPVVTSSVTQNISIVASTSVDGTLINQAATITAVTAATSSSLAIAAAAGLRVVGWTVRETGGATAEIALRQGASTGVKIMDRNLIANSSITDFMGDDGLTATAGVYVDRSVAGTTEVMIYTKVQA